MNRSHGDKKTDENDGLVARLKKGFQHLFNKRVMAPAAPLADTKEELTPLRQRQDEAPVAVGRHLSRQTGNLVNDGTSSLSTQPINPERTSVTTHSPTAAGHRTQNDRRLSATSISPIDRYRSPSSSLPDYGPLSRRNIMASRLKQINAQPGPRNTLSNTLHADMTNQSLAKRKTEAFLAPNPAKRIRIDDGGATTQARFGLVQDPTQTVSQHKHPAESVRSSRSIGEGSVHKATARTEFGAVEDRHQGGVRRRSRRQRSSTFQKQSDNDPIVDVDSENERLGTRAGRGENGRTGHDPANGNIFAANARRLQASKSALGHAQQPTLTTVRDSDMDELSPNFEESLHLDADTDAEPKRGVQSTQSASHSTRGNLLPSTFALQPNTQAIPEGAISLKAAVWQPHNVYCAQDGKGPCHLRSGNEDLGRNTLYLIDASGRPAHEAWLVIEPNKVEAARVNLDSKIIKLTMPKDLARDTGRFLYLEFSLEADCKAFVSWVAENTQLRAHGDHSTRLRDEFQKSFEDVSKHQKLTPAHSRPPPATSKSSSSNLSPPMDVAWMQHKQALRQAPRYEPIASQALNKQARERDKMMNEAAPTHTGARFAVTDHEDVAQDEPGPRRSTRAPALRSKFSLAASFSPDPEPNRWSQQNPDWDKEWRMALAYQRTMVEKDDIPRLDEGQCLNDNLIGFYLRYLYTKLEKEHPETAKRVYFHNSFFYEKLKPTVRGKINYDGVKNWTNKVDLLSYDYIVVPVNEHFHWWVAIICNPAKLDPEARKDGSSHDDNTSEIEAAAVDQDVTEGKPPGEDGTVELKSGTDVQQAQEVVSAPEDQPPLVVSDIPTADATAQDKTHGKENTANTTDVETANNNDSVIEISHGDQPKEAAKDAVAQQTRKPTKKLFSQTVKKVDPADPRIITLDSLGSAHSPVCQQLKQYLLAEFKDKKNRDVEYTKPVGLRANNLPEQKNFTDCGVYLLNYVEKFLEDPDKFVLDIMKKQEVHWSIDSSKTRTEIRDLIFKLHKEYQEEQEAIRRRKAKQKERGQAQARSSVPLMSSPAPVAKSASPRPANDQATGHFDMVAERVNPGTRTSSPPLPLPAVKNDGEQKHDVEFEKTSKPEPIDVDSDYAGTHNNDNRDTLGDQESPIPVPDSPPVAPFSRPVQSVEVYPAHEIEVVLEQRPSHNEFKRVSPALPIEVPHEKEPIEVRDDQEPIEVSDDKDVDLVGVSRGPSSAVKKRTRSGSDDGQPSADHKKSRRDQEVSPDLGFLTAAEKTTAFYKATYDGSPASQPFASVPKRTTPVKVTYAGHVRRGRRQEIAVKSRSPAVARPGLATSTAHVDLTED